ncbi:MAG TPA: hypothetical protein VHD91_05290, partial [Gaiellaceae bacterium]|nr:hypothetical protein [Gaiellaceae bacterium]
AKPASSPARSASGTLGTSATRGTLPFTGLSLLIPVLLGILLIGGGIALTRAGRGKRATR